MRLWRPRSKRRLDKAIRHAYQLYSEDRDQENLEFLESARREFPGSAEIQILYAAILHSLEDEDTARQAEKAADLAPDDPAIQLRAANFLLSERDDAARVCLRRARELAKPDFVLMAGLENCEGILLFRDGHWGLAEEKFRSAVASDPDFAPYAIHLASLLANQRRMTEAIEVIDEALERVKDKDKLQGLRARIVADVSQVNDEDRPTRSPGDLP